MSEIRDQPSHDATVMPGDARGDATAAGEPAAGTGSTGSAAARTRLAELMELPVAERVEGYDEVHRLLADELAAVQTGTGG